MGENGYTGPYLLRVPRVPGVPKGDPVPTSRHEIDPQQTNNIPALNTLINQFNPAAPSATPMPSEVSLVVMVKNGRVAFERGRPRSLCLESRPAASAIVEQSRETSETIAAHSTLLGKCCLVFRYPHTTSPEASNRSQRGWKLAETPHSASIAEPSSHRRRFVVRSMRHHTM